MFYDIFTNLCDIKGISPTATLQKLGISTSKLTAWKNGSLPSASVLILLSEFFGVTIDYLLTGEEKLTSSDNLTQNETEMLAIFQKFSDREQVKIIGRMEEWLEIKNRRESISQSQVVGVQVARRTDGKFVKKPVTAEELKKIEGLPEDTDF